MKAYRTAYWVMAPLFIVLAILATVHGDGDPSEYCTNEKCITAADQILHSQNLSVNPCDNFYAHACSGPKGDPIFQITLKIHDEISELFKNLQPSDMEALKKSKKFHDACTDRNALIGQGVTPIERILLDNGVWPLTVLSDEWNNQSLGWQEIHENFAKRTGVSALFEATVETDRNNSDVHILSLGVPTVPSKRAHFISRTKRETRSADYRRYLRNALEKFKKLRGFDIKPDDLLADFQGIIAFEDKLDELAILLDDDPTDNVDDLRITTIETLQSDWDAVVSNNSVFSINWLKTINDRFEGTGIVIDATEKIALKPASFVANFTRVLVNTPYRTIVNYIYWKVVDNLLPFVRSGLYNPHARGIADAATLEGLCINGNKLFHAVAYMYVKRHFNVQLKTAALEIVQNIEEEIKREIVDSSWLDEATRTVAREKVDAMTNFIGYPDWYDEPGKIDEYYKELTVGPNHFENVIAYNKFEVKRKLSKLRSPADKSETEWIAPYIINAEYLQQPNAMSFPAAILQSPFFDYERPSVLNYASFGAIAGHEAAHGFDPKGRHFDGAGRKGKWWSQSTIDTYKTKAQCFIKQYDNYTTFDENGNIVHLNGTETQIENIADAMGFRAALKAYQRLKNDGKTNNVKIQQFRNFSDEQLYFYGLTYTMCQPDGADVAPTGGMDSHSPARLRIIGALSNMQEFADAFHCPPGSFMNPVEKCLIWD